MFDLRLSTHERLSEGDAIPRTLQSFPITKHRQKNGGQLRWATRRYSLGGIPTLVAKNRVKLA